MGSKHRKSAQFRFYEELNDFLPPDKQKMAFAYLFDGTPAVKDAIEALGVPHTEIELILVNGVSVGFAHHLADGDRVSVYPVCETIDVSPIVRLRDKPLRRTAFILDVHLGKLARLLRMLGFDASYENDYNDMDIIRLAAAERRIILTRDKGILKTGSVTHGYWIRSADPDHQLREVVGRFDLTGRIEPFRRCMECNGVLARVDKNDVLSQIPARTAIAFSEFYRCPGCGKVYWKGSHYDKMKMYVQEILGCGNLEGEEPAD
ncbi:MAG: Mut7-C ubiquitin/RNAse domain-containing protein [Candidatus Latescibacterota bacterium]|nr:MAG: Mut7-C ubiquitin/RNAse domain-containing protein [Candidatus Latescibacterota bacterium]